MTDWNAEEFATIKHRETGCLYDSFDYTLHLKSVVAVCDRYVATYFPSDIDQMVIRSSCWCHDLIEDARVTYNDLVKQMNSDVADVVYAVSSEMGKNRKERNSKTYPKIKANSKAIFVKLCDRVANSAYSYLSGSSMYDKYKREYLEFKSALYEEGQFSAMWEELNKLNQLR